MDHVTELAKLISKRGSIFRHIDLLLGNEH
jgi:hypothetical protein